MKLREAIMIIYEDFFIEIVILWKSVICHTSHTDTSALTSIVDSFLIAFRASSYVGNDIYLHC